MKNPLKFIQEVKQEVFRITWPTKKDTMMGAVMVFALASIAAIFFFNPRSDFKIFSKFSFNC
jgi:preprotein translocase subunit SecE